MIRYNVQQACYGWSYDNKVGDKVYSTYLYQSGFGIRAIKADLGSRLLDPLFFTAPDSALDLRSGIRDPEPGSEFGSGSRLRESKPSTA